jgi:hypothetical protein
LFLQRLPYLGSQRKIQNQQAYQSWHPHLSQHHFLSLYCYTNSQGSHHFLHFCMICSFQSSILRSVATRLWYSCWSPFTSLLATFRVYSSQWLPKPPKPSFLNSSLDPCQVVPLSVRRFGTPYSDVRNWVKNAVRRAAHVALQIVPPKAYLIPM